MLFCAFLWPVVYLLLFSMSITFWLGYHGLAYTEAEDARSLTPLTAQVPLPPLDELRTGCFYLGSVDGVHQYLCQSSSTFDDDQGECELSEAFTAHYDEPIFCCKRRAR